MIRRYLLSRKEIISLILKAEKTKDSYYYYAKFDEINTLSGKEQDDYFYPREIFMNKIYFADNDIKLYLAKKKINNFDEIDYQSLNKKFKDIFNGLENLKLNEFVPGYKYTINDIIDNFEFKYNYFNK